MRAATPKTRELARELRDEGLSYLQIADRLSVAKGSVYRWLNPDVAKRYRDSDNASPKRRAAKRSWENAHDRGVCACGAIMAVGAGRRGFGRCWSCECAARRDARDARRDQIAALYREGGTLAIIAGELDSTTGSIGVELARMRADGWDLPYRRAGWKAKATA